MKAPSSLPRLLVTLLATAAVAGSGGTTANAETIGKVAETKHPHVVVLRPRRVYGTETFTLGNDAKVRLGSSPDASLMDLRIGETAHVSYSVENGTWLVHQIVVNPPQSSQGGSHAQHSYEKNELHAHGVIVGYDASAGTITLRRHR